MKGQHYLPKSVAEKIVGTPEYYAKNRANTDKRMNLNISTQDEKSKKEAFRINQHLQRIVRSVHSDLKENENFQDLVKEYNRKSNRNYSILYLRGRQQYEDLNSAVLSLKFIFESLLLSSNIKLIKSALFNTRTFISSFYQVAPHNIVRDLESSKLKLKKHLDNINQ